MTIGDNLNDLQQQEEQEITNRRISPIEVLKEIRKNHPYIDDFTEDEKEAIRKEELNDDILKHNESEESQIAEPF